MTDTTAGAPETVPEASEAATADPVAALAKEAADLKDRLLRTLAEMENLRRRTEREVAESRVYAVTNFARDILAVADNMERAMKALDDEIREKADAGVKALLDGVELTERELIKVMEKHGFIHAGIVTMLCDTACGFAALSLMPEDAAVLTTEFKVNLLSPAKGERLIAHGRVVRPGKRLMVCLGEVFAEDAGRRKQVALMTASMMVMDTSTGLRD